MIHGMLSELLLETVLEVEHYDQTMPEIYGYLMPVIEALKKLDGGKYSPVGAGRQ